MLLFSRITIICVDGEMDLQMMKCAASLTETTDLWKTWRLMVHAVQLYCGNNIIPVLQNTFSLRLLHRMC